MRLNYIVQWNDEDNTRKAEENSRDLDEKGQTQVITALRALTSENAQRNLSLLLAARGTVTDNCLLKILMTSLKYTR